MKQHVLAHAWNVQALLLCLLVMLAGCMLVSCDDDDDVATPVAGFTVSATDIGINETVTFTYTGTAASQVVFFPGDEGHDYDYVNNGSVGIVMSKGKGTYAYKKAGTYKAVVVATNYNKKAAKESCSMAEATITVTDDDCRLASVLLQKDLYNKEMAAEIGEDYVFVPLPYKVNVNGRDIAIKPSAQRITVTAASANATVSINGEPFSDKTKYDLTAPMTIDVQAASGDIRSYRLYSTMYPVFETFTINGIAGTVAYSAYDYDRIFVTLTLPAGTDLTRLSPVFSSADAQSVSVEGVEQVSGQSVCDFSSPVTYTLTNSVAGNPALECHTNAVVTVTTK